MKKITLILSAFMLISFAIPSNNVLANNESLIEFSLDNNSDLQALNTNISPDQNLFDNEVVSRQEVVSNNNHFDSNISNNKKEVKQANTISASEWLIVAVWGISVLLSSLYIKKIKRFN